MIWVGTDDGLVHLTRDDGKTWTNVTPPRTAGVGHGRGDRAVAARRRHRLRGRRRAPARRPAAATSSAPPTTARAGEPLRRPAAGRAALRRARGPGARRPALSPATSAASGLARRRDDAGSGSTADLPTVAVSRPRGQARRPGASARAGRSIWILDDLHAAARTGARSSAHAAVAPVRAARRRAAGSTPATWGDAGGGAEPAARRARPLPAGGEGRGRGDARDPRRARPAGAPAVERRREGGLPAGRSGRADGRRRSRRSPPTPGSTARSGTSTGAGADFLETRQDRPRLLRQRAAAVPGTYTLRLDRRRQRGDRATLEVAARSALARARRRCSSRSTRRRSRRSTRSAA